MALRTSQFIGNVIQVSRDLLSMYARVLEACVVVLDNCNVICLCKFFIDALISLTSTKYIYVHLEGPRSTLICYSMNSSCIVNHLGTDMSC